MVHKLMKKMFLQLIGEFRRLGSTIVYADFSKIVVCTKKKSMSDASAYIKFILHSIKNRELFHSLTMDPSRCWEYLWWMDQANYGGVSVPLPKSLDDKGEGGEDREGGEGEEEGLEMMEVNGFDQEDQRSEGMEMSWNIRQYLPQAGSCQDLFNVSVPFPFSNIPFPDIPFQYVIKLYIYTVFDCWSHFCIVSTFPG